MRISDWSSDVCSSDLGFGWFARWAREEGAAQVLGLDISEKMIARARADTADAAIEYRIADLEALALPEEAFDLAFSAPAFHYVEDFGRLERTVQRRSEVHTSELK